MFHETGMEAKLIDFQGVNYNSLGVDLSFFLFTSVEHRVRTQHLEALLRRYSKVFGDTVSKLDSRAPILTYKVLIFY